MFQVEWLQSALDELSTIWMSADSATRRTLTDATRQIDLLFQADAENAGESRVADRRILFVPPLGLRFRVAANRRVVTVLRV